jgi:hypothetical protein
MVNAALRVSKKVLNKYEKKQSWNPLQVYYEFDHSVVIFQEWSFFDHQFAMW